LNVQDRIELTLSGDEELLSAARTHEDYVAGETLATSLAYKGADGAHQAEIEGRALAIGVRRV
jgi:isoleucyl-tRNA synthetase